jgi:hypothetical protein
VLIYNNWIIVSYFFCFKEDTDTIPNRATPIWQYVPFPCTYYIHIMTEAIQISNLYVNDDEGSYCIYESSLRHLSSTFINCVDNYKTSTHLLQIFWYYLSKKDKKMKSSTVCGWPRVYIPDACRNVEIVVGKKLVIEGSLYMSYVYMFEYTYTYKYIYGHVYV